jgi:hypothetical protein
MVSDHLHFLRSLQWYRQIIANRPKDKDNLTRLRDINDIQNGMFVGTNVHCPFNARRLVILKVRCFCLVMFFPSHLCLAVGIQTPNHILSIADITQRHQRSIMPPDVQYPTNARYTLNWLKTPDDITLSVVPNNRDAAFKTSTSKPKPTDLLLHYNYGAAAVKLWGHGVDVLQNRSNSPRPSVPVQAEMGPSRTQHDRAATIKKLDNARGAGGVGVGNAPAGVGEMVDSGGQALWDEDDVMLFLWGNTKASKDRYRKKKEESTQCMEQWREGVFQVSV